ncbi:MAG: methyltransferase domain-containing protein, partial [Alphaproteobacteria bacterium]|nr:methyltransferase domain-containing protein [Alphaproteobacteria bacterium]
EHAAIMPGERVIDVGCGCGATALELAARVGPSGFVVGIDVSQPMLKRARERARAAGVANIEFIHADAATHTFSLVADLLFSRTGVMFFSDPIAAFGNLRRALRAGGRLAFVCFRERQHTWWTVPLSAVATIVAAGPATPPHQPDPFSLRDDNHLRSILDGAGFIDVVCEAVDYALALGADLDSATDFVINAGPAARALASVNDQHRMQAREVLRQALSQHQNSAGVSLIGVNLKSSASEDRGGVSAGQPGSVAHRQVIGEGRRGWSLQGGRGVPARGKVLVEVHARAPRSSARGWASDHAQAEVRASSR